jgi:uncharacterized membrane protein
LKKICVYARFWNVVGDGNLFQTRFWGLDAPFRRRDNHRMMGTIEGLSLAVACFVGGHFILSSVNIRKHAITALGETGFRASYSLLAIASMVWSVMAYGAAPEIALWRAGMTLTHVPVVLMPFACILAVAGLSSRSITVVGGESMAGEPDAVSGITTITRHPFLWALTLWAIGHIAASGDAAGLILFGGMAVLALGGMAHIDHRRHLALGSNWGPVVMTTSVMPFLAAIQGRRPIDWRGIGWARFAGGIALYFAMPFLHAWAGKPILPDFLTNILP